MIAVQAKQITGKVVDTRRAGTSTMGNPTYEVSIAVETIDGTPAGGTVATVRTQSNSSLGYAITNPEYREHAHLFTLTKAGRISRATRLPA